MSVDPGETNDLSEQHPDVLKQLLVMWDQYVEQTGTVWGPDKEPIGAKSSGWTATPDVIGGE